MRQFWGDSNFLLYHFTFASHTFLMFSLRFKFIKVVFLHTHTDIKFIIVVACVIVIDEFCLLFFKLINNLFTFFFSCGFLVFCFSFLFIALHWPKIQPQLCRWNLCSLVDKTFSSSRCWFLFLYINFILLLMLLLSLRNKNYHALELSLERDVDGPAPRSSPTTNVGLWRDVDATGW